MSFFVVGVNPATPLDVDGTARVTLQAIIRTTASGLGENLLILLVVYIDPRSALNCICDCHCVFSFRVWLFCFCLPSEVNPTGRHFIGLTLHITGIKKHSEERAALFYVRVHVIVMWSSR